MEMRIIKIPIITTLLTATLLLFTACQKDDTQDIHVDQVLTGTSTHWQVDADTEGSVIFKEEAGKLKVVSDGTMQMTLKYLGEASDLEDMKTLEIAYGTGGIKSESDQSLVEGETDATFSYKVSLNAMDVINISNDGTYEIRVTWDGKSGSEEAVKMK